MDVKPSSDVTITFTHPLHPRSTLVCSMTTEFYDQWAPVLRAWDSIVEEMRAAAKADEYPSTPARPSDEIPQNTARNRPD